MRHFSAWVLVIGLLLGAVAGRAQSAAFGDWQLHLPAQQPLVLADVGDRLYVADNSSFYFYDRTSNSTQQLSRRDGLSDVGVQALAYDSASAQLVVAYRNGNIDILGKSGSVRNVTDLLRKDVQTAKTVNRIQIYNGVAYLSTTLGVLVLDLARLEVRDTYAAIGPGGAAINAYATVVLHDTIFAATSRGLLRGRLNAANNLLDYRSWTTEVPVPSKPGQVFVAAAAYRGHLYVASEFQGVEYLVGAGASRAWRNMVGSYGGASPRLRPSAVGIFIAFRDADLRRFNALTGQITTVLPAAATGEIYDVVREADGTYFVASASKSLLRFGPGITSNPEVIRPNAPATASAFSVLADAKTNTVDIFTGGYSGDGGLQQGQRLGFYEYQNGQWTNYNPTNFSATDFPDLLDLSHGTRTPDGTLYIGSYGNGLLEWKGPGQYKQYTFGTPGSPLRSSLSPDASNPNFVRVPDVAADPNNGRVWVVNRHQRTNVPGLLRLRPSTGTWDAVPAYAGFENLDRVTVDNLGNPWATRSRQTSTGLVAYDTTSRTPYYFTTTNGLPSNSLYAIVRDRNGDLWVGTAAGVATCNPSLLATNGTASNFFTLPIACQGAGNCFPTLYSEAVTCIAIDGANRKWFGTANGLWLFDEKASVPLLHFTTANSPLPSNNIVDVAVNDKTGDVFVATQGGVVSYHGSATVTEGAPSCAQVFPNPVRPDFIGTVGINGVVNNGFVKITDIAGHLVYSTRAAGGTVTWNLADADGRRVRSGVYLVLTSDAEGKNTCVSKVAVLSK
jgi:hypothetical protein